MAATVLNFTVNAELPPLGFHPYTNTGDLNGEAFPIKAARTGMCLQCFKERNHMFYPNLSHRDQGITFFSLPECHRPFATRRSQKLKEEDWMGYKFDCGRDGRSVQEGLFTIELHDDVLDLEDILGTASDPKTPHYNETRGCQWKSRT